MKNEKMIDFTINIEEIKKDLLIDDLMKIKIDSEIRKHLCVEELQKINKKLLKEYIICIDEFTIEPLLLEAYYCNKESKFIDSNMYCFEGQQNHFGELYFHEIGRGGVDICLSDGNYYLSFLIKNSLVTKGNKELGFFRQTQLYGLLKKFKSSKEFVLKKRKVAKDTIVLYTIRKGLVQNNGFKYEELAAVSGFELKDENQKRYRFDLETGHGKEKLIKDYIKKHPKELTEFEFKEKFLDYVPKEIRESGLI